MHMHVVNDGHNLCFESFRSFTSAYAMSFSSSSSPPSLTLFYPTPPFSHPLPFRFPLFQLLHVVHLEGVLLKKFS